MKDLVKTSHSEVESFLTCERRHYYGYGKKLSSRTMSQALVRGIVGHEILAKYYSHIKERGDSYTELDAYFDAMETIAENDDLLVNTTLGSELQELMSEYVKLYLDKDKDMQVLEVEKEYQIPVGNGFFIKMVVDLIARTWAGIEVWDHKFVYDFYSPNQVDLNPQLPKYIGALQREGYVVDKARYNEIRYRTTKASENNPEARFHRPEVKINQIRIDRTMQEQISAAESIKKLRAMPLEQWEQSVRRTASSIICERCPFKTICAMDLSGEDTTLEEQFSFTTERRERK